MFFLQLSSYVATMSDESHTFEHVKDIYRYTYIYSHIYIDIDKYMYIYMCIYIYVYIYVCVCVFIHLVHIELTRVFFFVSFLFSCPPTSPQ